MLPHLNAAYIEAAMRALKYEANVDCDDAKMPVGLEAEWGIVGG